MPDYGNFSAGQASSEFDQTGFYALRGVDIHSKPGAATCSKTMTDADSGGAVGALCTPCVTIPDGNSFFGDSAGKIYKVTTAGVVSEVHSIGATAIVGMDYHNGYLYYSTAANLGRITLALAVSEATWSSEADTFGAYTNDNAYKPMVKQNLSLFIGDGNLVAAVDDTDTFSANVLDLEENQVITALFDEGENLLIGTISTNAGKSGLFLWDTYSSSWITKDFINENGINCFIKGDNVTFISAGTVGNIYYWTGTKAEMFTRLVDGSNAVTTSVNSYASTNLNGLPLFATDRGIFSLGRAGAKFPVVQCLEYIPSAGQGTEIGGITNYGTQVFAAHKDGTDYGIDQLSTTLYSGVIETPVSLGKASRVKVFYSALPTSTNITMKLAKDGGAFATVTLVKDATNEKVFKTDKAIGNIATLQAQITLVSSTTTCPEIYNIQIT